ncbi:MAG: flagellar hook-basal body complex protein FliE [Alphaproteobacteria bacterium]|nr:flagellar hook-basal body complex protein FliE [Alphaproteobacteria bacterium]
MNVPFSAAVNAYGATANLTGPASAGGALPELGDKGVAGPSFGELLNSGLEQVVEAGRASDQAGMNLVNGRGDIVDVVTALSETEIAMETMVTIRDKVISSYETIMRMPI